MKSKIVRRLLRLLIALSGAGVGMAVALAVMRLRTWTNPGEALPIEWIITLYLGSAAAGALIFFLLGGFIIAKGSEWAANLENRLDKLTMAQLSSSILGLVSGLLIAALVSQVVGFLGASMFTTAFSALLYVFLGALGLSIGLKRSDDMGQLLGRLPGLRERRVSRKAAPHGRVKLLDTSVIIDGRILDVCKTGFMEGELIVPDFVLDELRHIADSSDNSRRARGRRGLDILKKLQEEPGVAVRVENTGENGETEVDVRLLRLAQQTGGAIVTGDYNLNKAASISGVGVMNLNDLARALRPVVLPGEEMSVAILKEGKEPGQGVGYLEDGTMIVVEGGQGRQGQSVVVVVTSALQTSAGRMIFARLKA